MIQKSDNWRKSCSKGGGGGGSLLKQSCIESYNNSMIEVSVVIGDSILSYKFKSKSKRQRVNTLEEINNIFFYRVEAICIKNVQKTNSYQFNLIT